MFMFYKGFMYIFIFFIALVLNRPIRKFRYRYREGENGMGTSQVLFDIHSGRNAAF